MPPASERFRVESRPSTLSVGRKARGFLANLLAGGVLGTNLNWPPVDVVLLDAEAGTVLKRWQEFGTAATELLRTLAEDLEAMSPEDFADKWDVVG